MAFGLDWDRDGPQWPLHETSRFVEAAGLRWHVQVYGEGPPALLVHGTAASAHTWRGLGPILAQRWRIIAPDLPGHGFTQAPPRALQTLPGTGQAVAELLAALGESPQWAVGHSSGAALLARMALDGHIAPQAIVGLNAAFFPFSGVAGHIFPTTARLLTYNPLVPFWLAFRARNRAFLADVLARTGSRLDDAGIDLYQRLGTSPAHVAAALGMMARSHDDLYRLVEDLPSLDLPLVLLAATNDRTVPPQQAQRARSRVPHARIEPLEGLGHLAHEEDPEGVARRMLAVLDEGAPKGRGPVIVR